MADPIDLATLIEAHPLFNGIPQDIRDLLGGCSHNVVFHDGDLIIKEGGQADRCFLIRHGRVALDVHLPGRERILLDTVSEGDVLGWSWMVPPYHWAFDGRAIGLVRAISIDAVCLRNKCEQDPRLGFEIYRRFAPVIASRLNTTRVRLIDMYRNPQDNR